MDSFIFSSRSRKELGDMPKRYCLEDLEPRQRLNKETISRLSPSTFSTVSEFGNVVGYDPLEHTYLRACLPWQEVGLVEYRHVNYREEITGGNRVRKLDFELHLTQGGKRAWRLADLELWWVSGRVDLGRSREHVEKTLRSSRIPEPFIKCLLKNNDNWLREYQEIAVGELLTRTLRNGNYVRENHD